ncbi:hypothetical protein [Hathewaya massiliensis]|nr:hypothetical protein [Hathewaya massiliensis]
MAIKIKIETLKNLKCKNSIVTGMEKYITKLNTNGGNFYGMC